MKRIFRVGVVGMGGYGIYHHDAIRRLEQAGELRLVCTCDPRAETFVKLQENWQFKERGVRVFNDLESMLAACASDLDVLVISTPILLHLDMHRQCQQARLACYLEKPPTLDYRELEAMIETERSAEKQTLVGFNYISEPMRLALKQRLLQGEFGQIKSASLVALWSRTSNYFVRNGWGGRLKQSGKLVLDSCFGNAMSHFVHNMLFWLGRDQLYSWAPVTEVQAALYRAYAIEGADTFFVETRAGGVSLRIAMTHACDEAKHQTETLVCERATISYTVEENAKILWHDGREEVLTLDAFRLPDETHLAYLRYLRGESSRPITTLEDCRDFVHLNDLAYISSQTIQSISPQRLVLRHNEKDNSDHLVITDLASEIHHFVESGIWPHLEGKRSQNTPEKVAPHHLPLLPEVIESMIASAPTPAK